MTSVSRLLALSAALLLLAIAGLAIWQAKSAHDQAARKAAVEAENAALQARLRELKAENDRLRQAAGVAAAVAPHRQEDARPALLPTSMVEAVRALGEARDKLAAANASIADLQLKIQQMEAAIEKRAEENQSLAAASEDLKERLGAANRLTEAVQAELKTRNERYTQLEIAVRGLRESNAASADKLTRISQAAREMEDLNQRREVLLNSLLRRYRELTDLYRSTALRLDQAKDTPPAPGELSRLQNVISLAEDDLHQLSNLSAQARLLQQKLR